jgi:hypothetical protein
VSTEDVAAENVLPEREEVIGGWRGRYNEELHDSYSAKCIRLMK